MAEEQPNPSGNPTPARMSDVDTQPDDAPPAKGDARPENRTDGHRFPDPSLTLVEFGDALGVLIAGRTEADPAHRRLILKKVAYVRLESDNWGAATFAEAWIQQTPEGLFTVLDPATQKVFRDPSRRRYEVGFMTKDLFDCTIQCLKDRKPGPIYELAVVTFAQRKGFSVVRGGLVAPDDYASERDAVPADRFVPLPPRLSPAAQ
jgi:hypothetical protein